MPELPEVETIARALASGRDGVPSIVGRRVASAHVSWKRSIARPSAAEFSRRIVGQEILGVGRRGKFIKLDLTVDTLFIHLRMSGDLLVGQSEKSLGGHSRVQIYYEDGWQLSFNDPRKFGRMWLVKEPITVTGELGPEPFDPNLTSTKFHRMLAAKKRQLKPLLLDQTFLAGLGNIYADEALWTAKLHPLKPAHKVSKAQAGLLLAGIRRVLRAGIRRNGASIDWVYRGGDFQNHFKAYQRTGEPCPRCGTKIKRILVGQRSTHFCPRCQKQ